MGSVSELAPESLICRSDCNYTSCYCEENCYKLVEKLLVFKNFDEISVVFATSVSRKMPLWCQRAGLQRHDGFVLWDYHVFVVTIEKESSLVWDLDTTLDFPCSLTTYVAKAIRRVSVDNPEYQRLFRVISGEDYLENFASDRRHMKDDKGLYVSKPPSWPCIQTSDGRLHTLEEYTNTCADGLYGTPWTLERLLDHFVTRLQRQES